VVGKVAVVPGVASATGTVGADGIRVIGKNGKVLTSFGPPRLGVNWTGTNKMIELREGHGPTAPTEIAVNATVAKAAGLKLGDQVGVLTLQPKKMFTLVGIYGYSGGRDSLGGAQEVAFTTPVAQELVLGQKGVFSSIDVKAAPGTSDDALRAAVDGALGGQYQVKTGAQLEKETTDGFREGLKFFNYILLGFAGVALFVGTFLILNTFSIIVAQRTRELALMRAIGASRKQMIGSVLLEAVAIGLLASLIGLGAGIGVGALLAWVFGNVGGANLDLAGVGVPPAAIISAFVVGLVVTLVAAVLPALRASRIPPIAALQETVTPDRPLTKLSIAGALVGAAGGTALGLGLAGKGNSLILILGGVLVSFIGVALLTPLLARPVVAVLGRLFSWSVPGKLGRLNSGRNPRRTAITAAALMVGLALITGVNVILDSATKSLTKMVNDQVTADLVISGDGAQGMPATFDPAVLDKVRALPGVSQVAGEYYDRGAIDGERTGVSAVTDIGMYLGLFSVHAVSGSIDNVGPNQFVVDAKGATEHHLAVGDTITLATSRGEDKTMTLTGIYQDNDLYSGYLFNAAIAKDFRVDQPSWGLIKVAPGVNIDQINVEVTKLLADSPEVNVADRATYVKQQASQLDFLLTMIQILLALAILIAVLGIVNTLALSVLERTREIGLLRAIGLRRAQAMRMVTVEAVIISVFGALLGLGVGTGLGAAVVQALHSNGITELALPLGSMATYLALAAVVGVLAAILPAIRASRVNVLTAIAHE
jgi:putative ABC transport system permease protein